MDPRPVRAQRPFARLHRFLLLTRLLLPALKSGSRSRTNCLMFSVQVSGLTPLHAHVYDPKRGWIGGSARPTVSRVPRPVLLLGEWMQFNGCGNLCQTSHRPGYRAAEGTSPCPSGYRVGTSNNNYGQCVRVPVSWVTPGQDPGRVPGKPQLCVGNPCDPATGNKYLMEVDYVGAGPFPLRFVRYYNSLDLSEAGAGNARTRMGFNWRTNLDRRVSLFAVGGTNFVEVRDGPGRKLRMKQLSGGWTGDPDVTLALVRSPSFGCQVRNEQDESRPTMGMAV